MLLKITNKQFKSPRKKLDGMIHNIGYPDLVENHEQLEEEIQGVGRTLDHSTLYNYINVKV